MNALTQHHGRARRGAGGERVGGEMQAFDLLEGPRHGRARRRWLGYETSDDREEESVDPLAACGRW